MKTLRWVMLGSVAVTTLALSQATNTPPPLLALAEAPLFVQSTLPPLNMLVMGKDHKIYYEAYNDASDLDGDGGLDVGYKGYILKSPAPAADSGESLYKIDYYGYFNSYACYTWDGDKFVPQGATSNKQCSGQWSGDYLNYLTTSRMDALRRVLYGGKRATDTTTDTVLQGAFFPQDAHSWGKEYASTARDGYNIANYTPLSQPQAGKYHLFAVTTVTDNSAPLFRVMQNSDFRVWNWLSIEGPVANNKCFNSSNQRVDCVGNNASWSLVPASALSNLTITTWKRTGEPSASPGNTSSMNTFFTTHAVDSKRCGSGAATQINKTGSGNPFNGNNCGADNYLTRIEGNLVIPVAGNYTFGIDGDDAVDLFINGNFVAGWYGGHGNDRSDNGLNSHSATVSLTAGTHTITFRHQEGSGDDNWGVFWKSVASASNRTDYKVRVQTCPTNNAAVREANCKAYPNSGNPIYKPTGILHDYGETQKMFFGLITGSQPNNLEGGILRRNMGNLADEIDPATGVFRTNVNGVIRNIDGLRMIGGGYAGNIADNTDRDANWSWNNGNGNCDAGSIGGDPLTNGQCRMWGNPIAEMMYEALRYFAGAATPTTQFSSRTGNGATEETTMGLSSATWKDPYADTANNGLGFGVCSKPYQTVISDINPSYDGDLPGSAFSNASSNDTPTNIQGFNASGQGQVIWNNEFGSGVARNVFIGEVGGVTDGAPTAKEASSFGNIRGLSPEEPTKGGTYYAASVARYGRITDINAAQKPQNLTTYSIALASPLPRIEFPVGNSVVTLLPFAKTASGTFGGGTRKPTNTIVDFYVEQIVNTTGQPSDSSVNGGRPYAVFRINYEDVEQGNDHDMDAIVRYEIKANANGTVTVTLLSEYAAGSADQNIGYVISGTTQDGVYLEVRDTDSTAGSFRAYDFNTPPGVNPGGCRNVTTGVCNQQLPLTATRTFTPATTASSNVQLKDPLWYAAKYGGFIDANNDDQPQGAEWDSDGNGVPDNYFLVTNPLQLQKQLKTAFDRIQDQNNQPSGALSVAGARIGAESFSVAPSFSVLRRGRDWIGNVQAYRINSIGTAGDELWSAASEMPDTPEEVDDRKIYTALGSVTSANRATQVVEFRAANLGTATEDQFNKVGYTSAQVTNIYGGTTTPNQLVNYLRGDQSLEGEVKGVRPFRTRSSILGDIINSTPQIASAKDDYGWGEAPGLSETLRTSYRNYLTNNTPSGKKNRPAYVYVGANDGMLHAFDASTRSCTVSNKPNICSTATSGEEVFAYVPNMVLGRTGQLAHPEYGSEPTGHRYYVDGGIAISDVPSASGWTTVLAGSAGVGGRGVFALNIEDPDSFVAGDVLWEVNGSTATYGDDVGHVMGAPTIVPLDNGTWVALFGNGYNSPNGQASLFIVDINTGAVLKQLEASDGINTSNGLGNIAAIDSNDDGLVDTVYGGDLHGNLWKFDLSGNSASDWEIEFSGNPLFVATDADGARQPITSGLEVSAGPGSGLSVFFGTGTYFKEGDHSSTAGQQVQSLYSIWDNGERITGDREDALQEQLITSQDATSPSVRRTTTNTVNYLTQRGWYLDLRVGTQASGAVGERFIGTPRLQNGKVFFTTYVPQGDSCTPGGKNWLYSLDAVTGAAAMSQISLDASGDPPVCSGADCGGISLSEGAPVRDTSVLLPTPNPAPGLSGGCVPGTAGCEPPNNPDDVYQRCTVVIRASGAPPLYLPRPCGRQSWRQIR